MLEVLILSAHFTTFKHNLIYVYSPLFFKVPLSLAFCLEGGKDIEYLFPRYKIKKIYILNVPVDCMFIVSNEFSFHNHRGTVKNTGVS